MNVSTPLVFCKFALHGNHQWIEFENIHLLVAHIIALLIRSRTLFPFWQTFSASFLRGINSGDVITQLAKFTTLCSGIIPMISIWQWHYNNKLIIIHILFTSIDFSIALLNRDLGIKPRFQLQTLFRITMNRKSKVTLMLPKQTVSEYVMITAVTSPRMFVMYW